MPPRSSQAKSDSLTRSQLFKIHLAFNGDSISSHTSTARPRKKRRITTVPDDEEEGIGESSGLGGGFMPEESEGGGGGGFMEEEPEAQGLPNENETEGAGGFLTSDQDDSTTRPTFSRNSPPPPTGGLLRIPLRNIPTALAALDLPPNQQVLSLFKEVASDDEDGEPTVSKERFVQVLGVLMGGDDDSDSETAGQEQEEEEEEELSELSSSDDDEEEEEYREEAKTSRGRKGATRRITRASGGTGDGAGSTEEVAMLDNVSHDGSSEMDEEEVAPISSKAQGKANARGKNTKSGKISKAEQKKLDRTRAVTDREIEQAISTFSLFFESGNPAAGKKDNRKIGMKELRRACDLIKEDIDEDDLLAMLDLGSRGVVDLGSFAKILAEVS